MKTLGDYSKFCQELNDTLTQIAEGKFWIMDYKINPILLTLQEDELIEPLKTSKEFYCPTLTPKGREFINRGGYTDFDPNWQPNLFDKY